jgi:hypothetical protein
MTHLGIGRGDTAGRAPARLRSPPSVGSPISPAVRLRVGGTLLPGHHDVSGTDRQTLGRVMQSITTMMPV